jgi:hypothetical protein
MATTSKLEAFRKAKRADMTEPWKALHRLLEPIEWSWSSSVSARQNLVYKRRSEVALVLPFLVGTMRELASEWMREERHSGLWD